MRLGEYSEESLTEIVRRTAGPDADIEACRLIAKASRGTPREAVNLTKRLLAMASGLSRTLDADSVGELLAVAGIDDRGLDAADRKIVGLLRAAERPLALATLAAKAGIRKETLLERHEPFLLKLGLIEITLQGRVAVQN